MIKFSRATGLGLAAMLSSGVAAAAPAFTDQVKTQAFVGVSWNFTSSKPAFQVGLRRLNTRCDPGNDGLVNGWQMLTDLDIKSGFDKLRVEGVYGHHDKPALVTYGVGYSLTEKSFFGGVGAQGSRVFGRFDYAIGGAGATGLAAGLNTLSMPADCWAPA